MDLFNKILSEWNIDFDDQKLDMFEKYHDILVSWNKRINLTSITDKDDIYIKHFADSAVILKYMNLEGKTVIDIGTGAGFPGIPISILCPSCRVVLLDTLGKRIRFLNEVINDLGLENVVTVNGRAEDIAHSDEHREKYDIVTSRAVANMSTLAEYCLPFAVKNGYFISYKGGNVDDELKDSYHAIDILGGTVEKTESFILPGTDYERAVVFVKKEKAVDTRFPRRAGIPSKKPL